MFKVINVKNDFSQFMKNAASRRAGDTWFEIRDEWEDLDAILWEEYSPPKIYKGGRKVAVR